MTMFKKSGRGFKKPFCINPKCSRFLPEDQRGYPKKKTAEGDETEAKTEGDEKSTAKKATTKKTAAKKTTAKKAATTKKTAAKKTTATKKTTAKKATAKKTASKQAAVETPSEE